MGIDRNSIGDRSASFALDYKARRLCMALAQGVEAIKADGRKEQAWIWPAPGDMEKVEVGGAKFQTYYDLKVKGLRARNVWLDSIRSAAALPFDKSVALEGWPVQLQGSDDLKGWAESIDDLGNTITQHWAHAFLWKMIAGAHYILIDLPSEVGGRPYWVSVGADQLLDVVTSFVGGKHRAEEVRIRAPALAASAPGEAPDDWPVAKVVQRVKIYRTAKRRAQSERGVSEDGPVSFRHAKLNEHNKWEWEEEWQELEASSGVFQSIPLVPLYSNRVAPFRGEPRFSDTAVEQAALIRALADYDQREQRDARSLAVFSGISPEQVHDLGGVIVLASDKASAQLLETTGTALEALREGHRDRVDYIRAGNLRPLLTKPQPMTATEIRVSELGAASELEQSVLADLSAIELALEWTTQLAGIDSTGGTVTMPHDFSLDSTAVEKIWQGYIEGGGQVPAELAFREVRRAGWIHESESPGDLAKQAALLAVPEAQ